MALRIGTNVAAINSQRTMADNQRAIDKTYSQLASGSRINKSADDAAGLAISENMRAQLRSGRQARRNANDGISFVQVAEGGLNQVNNMIIRLRELSIQAASDTVGEAERGYIQQETEQIKNEIDRVSRATKWNTTQLLDGSSPVFDFQIGIHSDPFLDQISFDASQLDTTLEGLDLQNIDLSEKETAQEGLAYLDRAQEKIGSVRASFGALQNRLAHTIDNLQVFEENTAAAKSRIKDTDFAEASAEMTKQNILLQASTAMLAQANQKNNLALGLIG